MYQKNEKSEYEKSEYRETERKRQEKIFNNDTGGILRIEDLISKKIINEIPRRYFLINPKINLYEETRDKAYDYFKNEKIKWWKFYYVNKSKQAKKYEYTLEDMPSRHILSSQVSCLNHLFPIRDDKESVLGIAKIICPDFVDVLRIDTDKYFPAFIQFEAVSEIDHLNEVTSSKPKPIRGEYFTSIDALIYAVHKNGEKYLIPIEWKYTETETPFDNSTGKSGQTRLGNYSKLIDDSTFLKSHSPYEGSIYFCTPFYQLMRQTLWAEQMIKNKNEEIIKADNFIHVHIIPNENTILLNRGYKDNGKNLKDTWVECLKNEEQYKIIAPMDLLKGINKSKYIGLIKYITERYWNR